MIIFKCNVVKCVDYDTVSIFTFFNVRGYQICLKGREFIWKRFDFCVCDGYYSNLCGILKSSSSDSLDKNGDKCFSCYGFIGLS